MSKLNKLDCIRQDELDQSDLNYDHLYGWEIDVSDTWYLNLYTKKLGELDCYYHFSHLERF